jgi:hypothetical protein
MPSAKVRIGNWQEELAYEADRKALARDARDTGATLSQRILAKVKHHRQPVDVPPPAADGLLRFNRPYVLQNADTEGCLATDLDDKAQVGFDTRFACTTTLIGKPQLRATWTLVPVPSREDALVSADADPVIVHYGQRFVIQSQDGFSDQPLYLCSVPKSPTDLSRVTSNQEVFFATKGGANAIWTFAHGNSEYREDMVGKPVKGDQFLLLVHQNTNTPIASSKAGKLANDFGAEYEVCCHRYLRIHSKSGTAPEEPANLWIVTAPPREDA